MKRFLYGILSLFFAVLLLEASSYGAIGRIVSHTTHNLLGSMGVALLAVTLLAVAFVLIVPRSVRRWLFALPAMVAQAAQAAPVRTVGARPRRVLPRQQLVIVTGADLQALGMQGLIAAMHGPQEPAYAAPAPMRAVAPIEVPAELPPAERMRLTDVGTALKGLGYRAPEYAFVQQMDGKRTFEELVKEALAKLRKS